MNEAVENLVAANGRVCSKSQSCACDYTSEEELSVLPPHTKVVVTGNNRTKSVLVGLHGVVKKAVGLGGWHWLVLTNGIDVKLQRNALSVVEPPTGKEEDDDLKFDNMQWNGSDLGELASDDTQKSYRSIHRIHASTGSSNKNCKNACMSLSCDAHSKGPTTLPSTQDDTQKSHRSRHHTHKSTGSSHKNDHKNAKMPLSCDAQSKGPATTPPVSMMVDLSKLEKASLWRYWRYFNLKDVVSNPSEVELVDVVQTHFMSQKLDEVQVITEFAKSAKRLKTLDN